uniref:X8 domain-containing protein n=1 Tax=Zea mays TaxID=4577 RepID=A0A804Q4P9_MAIZE
MAVPLLLLLLLSVFTASDAAFCVCKPGMSDQMMQSAIDYACSKGADCASTTKGAPCYGNGNKVAVCSYICNSYYQSRSGMGATCDFNGVATLTGTDPSSGTCKFASGPSVGTGGGAGMGTGGAGAGVGGGTGAGAGTGAGMGAGAGTGAGTGMGAGTGTSTGAGAGTGTGAGITTPGALSPPFGGTGAYGPSGAGSTDYNDAAARRVSRLHVVAALVFGLAAAAAPLLR